VRVADEVEGGLFAEVLPQCGQRDEREKKEALKHAR
jgi:hypothetical protein